SSAGRRANQHSSSNVIGDRVDLRVCTVLPLRKVYDLLGVEFAKDSNSNKFFVDHRKILREVNIIADRFYSRFLKSREKRGIEGHSMQIAGPEGQFSSVKLVDNGLYVANHLGSLRLFFSTMDLRNLQTLLERLFTVKHILPSQKAFRETIEHNDFENRKSIGALLNMKRYTYSPSIATYTSWVRGTWFCTTKDQDHRCKGEWGSFLFSPLQSSIFSRSDSSLNM
ncbi:hypothetical protein BDB01DRAFT_719708, partial [Pilobolus umbonatus]